MLVVQDMLQQLKASEEQLHRLHARQAQDSTEKGRCSNSSSDSQDNSGTRFQFSCCMAPFVSYQSSGSLVAAGAPRARHYSTDSGAADADARPGATCGDPTTARGDGKKDWWGQCQMFPLVVGMVVRNAPDCVSTQCTIVSVVWRTQVLLESRCPFWLTSVIPCGS